MQSAIIVDASCLILLQKIGELEILRLLFERILVTPEVAGEFQLELLAWIELAEPSEKNYQKILESNLDKGEASVIALALELDDCLLIIDDSKGRKHAQQLGIAITGTVGVIVNAKQRGHIESVQSILDKIRKTNFRLTPSLERWMLQKSGEV